MSNTNLLTFVQQNVKECPELLFNFGDPNSNENKQTISYLNLYSYFRLQQRRYPIQGFLDLLMYDTICKCSVNRIEYDYLQSKVKKISQLAQALFDLEFGISRLSLQNKFAIK